MNAVVEILAALKGGATFCVVNASTKAQKLGFVLNNCRATALLAAGELAAVAADAVEAAPSVKVRLLTGKVGDDAPPPPAGFLNKEEAMATVSEAAPGHRGIDVDLA